MLNWKQQLRDVESAYEDIIPDIGDSYNRTPHGSPSKSNNNSNHSGGWGNNNVNEDQALVKVSCEHLQKDLKI